MSLNLQVINPIEYRGWNELLLSNQEYSFFHSSNWAMVLYESYHYKPLYFTMIDSGRLLVLVPVMEIKSLFTGQRGVSLPFTDYCEPVIDKAIHFQDVLECLIEYGKNTGWKSVEIRGGGNLLEDLHPSSYYYGHAMNISRNEDEIFSGFKSNTKRNIRKAIREGVQVNIENSLKSIREFYRLNCMTRKTHGLPPQPYYFFKSLYDYIISENIGIVVLAAYKGKTIAGAVFFHFGKRAVYKYGASDRAYQHLRANNLIMWEAIRWYVRNGYKRFCFGRTEPENRGLRQFKSGWGTEEMIIKYYKYDFKKSAFVNGNSHMSGFHNKVFNKMPVPLLIKSRRFTALQTHGLEVSAAIMMILSSTFKCNPLELRSGEIHVWCVSLDQPASRFQELSQTLSPDEHTRAERFHFEKDRKHFVVSRGILRIILGSYLGAEPGDLQFCYGKHGKPALAGISGNERICFNSSRSEGLALYAFTRDREVGVDIQYIHDLPEMDQIVEHFFSVKEREAFYALPEDKRKETFFKYWTRKESFIKAIGDGLFCPMDSFDVSLSTGDPAGLLMIGGDSNETSGWSVRDLKPASGFAAAFAVEGRNWQLRCCRWPDQSVREFGSRISLQY